ncbi:MAG: alpha/beta hydrolase [Gammaproteobacteria bacterium]|nr:alpha/beta hydrolase [Gammaproteobacteria bacterium]
MRKLIFLLCFISINAFSEIGELTNVDGVKLYSEYYPNQSAKFKGTIIFINGSGTSMGEWGQNKKFFQCAKKAGSLFLYDRSSLGGSPQDTSLSTKNPITAKLISDQLIALLNIQKIKPPYIIVAHSYGGMYAGYFVLMHPNLVKAVLLVDPVPRDFYFSNALMRDFKDGGQYAGNHNEAAVYKKYKGETEGIYQMLGFSQSKDELKKFGAINNNIPVVIISSTGMEYKVKPIKEDWYTSQKQWLNKNPDSKIFQVKSGHFIQIDRPDVACKQIKKLIGIVNNEKN